ncbi:MAG: MotA/TolQ/ExbB proton channel family protein [Veillonellaceae bacterium]|nr:MotA/TolQ/ExbB proton channel family protein [Veillonellaceae bacterium]
MEIFALFQKGGLVMWPLLICSIIAICILIERIRTYRAAKSNVETLKVEIKESLAKGQIDSLRKAAEKDGGVAGQLLYTALEGKGSLEEQQALISGTAATIAGRLRAHLNYLDTIVTLAPLLGLLGTVTGMISAFSVMNITDGQPFAITGGVGEALIATATGLCVAILALIIHTYLAQQQDGLITDMEEVANTYISTLSEGDRHAI